MGRIIHEVKIYSAINSDESIVIDALVDGGASIMALPAHFAERFPNLSFGESECVTASEVVKAKIGWPVRICLTGFRPVSSEVAFLKALEEPLIGYTVLEVIPAAVDMLGHRIVPVKYLDMK